MKLSEILASKLPRKLSIAEGEFLKKEFIFIEKKSTENSKELYFRYIKEIQNTKYILTEEYLFRDNETIIDLKRAIAKNFYLRKSKC